MAPATFEKFAPPSVLTCHWTVGAGVPVAVEVKEAEFPAQTVLLVGLAVTTGREFTVMVALPEAVPVQFASATDVTVYVVVLDGDTSRVRGLVATLLPVAPSDQTTVQGAVPVKAAWMVALVPMQFVALPVTVAVGLAATVSVAALE